MLCDLRPLMETVSLEAAAGGAAITGDDVTAQAVTPIAAIIPQRIIPLLRTGVISSAPCSPRWLGTYGF